MNTRKVALITGSGKKRIGASVAEALAQRGYSLVVHYRTSREEAEQAVAHYQRQLGIEAIALQADLRDSEQVRAMVLTTLSKWSRIDVLVNCAAVWKSQRLEEIRADHVREHFETNTLGSFLMCQHVGLAMVEQTTGGCIVNVGDWAIARPYLDYASYFPSKGAIPTLTRNFAVELAHRNPNIRVNAVLPGPVMLPDDLPEEERQQAIDGTLLKREGTPENIVSAILFFVENDFVTGVCLPVDGGRTIR